MMVSLIVAFLTLNAYNSLIVTIRAAWIVSTILVVNHIINGKYRREYFEVFEKSAKAVGIILVANIVLSLLLIPNAFVPAEGLKSLIVSSDMSKKLALIILPFLFLSKTKNIFTGVFLTLYLLVGTRALMLATMVVLGLIIYFSIRKYLGSSIGAKTAAGLVVICSLFLSLLFTVNLRSGDITNIMSSVDRIVIWSQYANVIKDYPTGLGPEGAYYLIKENPTRDGLDLSDLSMILGESELDTGTATAADNIIAKRIRVNKNLEAKSAESLFFDLVGSYGVAGLILIGYLLVRLFRDIRVAATLQNRDFSIIYVSLCGSIVYGLFNSFHSAMLFLIILFISYNAFRTNKHNRAFKFV
tara:strand:- start:1125 stop:2195 length:1071 start_codon:yes stop_codon:yes gene_type:complete